jgi:hypothetical protein
MAKASALDKPVPGIYKIKCQYVLKSYLWA